VRELLRRGAFYACWVTRHSERLELLWHEGPAAFAFLVESCGFEGPELLEDGLGYHRRDLTVVVQVWEWRREQGFQTSVELKPSDTWRTADLSCLYRASGLGPVQHVGNTVTSLKTVRKRIVEHSRALLAVMPYLDRADADVLVSKCTS
jgi:hypothetical protein